MDVPIEILFSSHALKSMQERAIPEAVVRYIVNDPEQIVPTDWDDRRFYQSRYLVNGKLFLVRVLVADVGSPPVVITVYRTSNIRKFWRSAGGEREV